MAKKRKRRRRPRLAAPRRRPGTGGQRTRPGAAARLGEPANADGPPPAPWGSFPLVELVILIGIVMLVLGFIVGGGRGTVMIATGFALASLGGLELSVREHFSGYRSHTTLLAGLLAVVTLAVMFFAAPSLLSRARSVARARGVRAAAWGLTVAFRRASGGLAFRLRGFRG